MNFVNWHQVIVSILLCACGLHQIDFKDQDFTQSTEPGAWTSEVVAGPSPGNLSDPVPLQSSFYMELTALDDDFFTPVPSTKARLGCDSLANLLVNGKAVQLRPGNATYEVSFNAAGMIGIETPVNVFGGAAGVQLYPCATAPIIW